MSRSPWQRIGWRNLGRNRKRTVLTALGLAVGFFAVVFIVGWSQGIMAEMVESATSLVNGQIEIYDAEYRPDRSLYDTIGGRDGADVDALLRAIDADPAVVAAAPRVYAGGLISSGEATSAGMFMGIDPARELTLSRFLDSLVEGRMPVPGRNELLVGQEMARQLSARLDDELVGRGVRGRRVDGQRPLHARRRLPDGSGGARRHLCRHAARRSPDLGGPATGPDSRDRAGHHRPLDCRDHRRASRRRPPAPPTARSRSSRGPHSIRR